ncbi:hypothetical protein AH04_218 [Erwinia phage AH04]|uniref:Uncharacterized protein n=1 Tax=Erwinia phage AH04 TaxID=2869569 RepID=A0AAE8BQ61_9CAUD|nr:hypothetical protein PQC02_gp096 [Erwinia phage AH04]QZA70693.1 hypothetical protein AH04_218 [Erwinia phage AH04]
MIRQTKRDVAAKARFAIALLIALVAILGIMVSDTDKYPAEFKLVLQVLFSVYCVAHGYIMGWDANKKPSILKGP